MTKFENTVPEPNEKVGSDLQPEDQQYVLETFRNRFTGEHKPSWVTPRSSYSVQFKDDADWLAHTYFVVNNNGRVNKNFRTCRSYPTWPEGCPPMPVREFEIYEGGDPYSNDWETSEITSKGTFYVGGLRAPKAELVRRLRRDYPGCVIRYRNTGQRMETK